MTRAEYIRANFKLVKTGAGYRAESWFRGKIFSAYARNLLSARQFARLEHAGATSTSTMRRRPSMRPSRQTTPSKPKRTVRVGWCQPYTAVEKTEFGFLPSKATLQDVGGLAVWWVDPPLGGYNVPEAYYVWHSNSAGTDEPWRLHERHVVGSRGAVESSLELEQFRTFREAMKAGREHAERAARMM